VLPEHTVEELQSWATPTDTGAFFHSSMRGKDKGQSDLLWNLVLLSWRRYAGGTSEPYLHSANSLNKHSLNWTDRSRAKQVQASVRVKLCHMSIWNLEF
jgi:hypothetical protein